VQDDHGTYRNSRTKFKLLIGPRPGEKWRGEVVWDLYVRGDFG